MSFHEVRFPSAISFGATGGPKRRTEIVTQANGFEHRNSPWVHSRREYNVGYGIKDNNQLAGVIEFFEARRGQLYGFRFKDWSDYKSCRPLNAPTANDQIIGIGDGETTDFQLTKTYNFGDTQYNYVRDITKPVDGTVKIAIDGVVQTDNYLLDSTSGIVVFGAPPTTAAVITAGYEFDVPVRFGNDMLEVNLSNYKHGSVPNIAIVEIRIIPTLSDGFTDAVREILGTWGAAEAVAFQNQLENIINVEWPQV